MKELTKIQVAAIKRTNQNVKPMLKKIASLQEKIDAMAEEIAVLNTQVDAFEHAVITMTGGLTSTQYLEYLETGVSPAEEATTEEELPTTAPTNNVEELPFGNPSFPTTEL